MWVKNTQNAEKYAVAQYAAYGVPHTDDPLMCGEGI